MAAGITYKPTDMMRPLTLLTRLEEVHLAEMKHNELATSRQLLQ